MVTVLNRAITISILTRFQYNFKNNLQYSSRNIAEIDFRNIHGYNCHMTNAEKTVENRMRRTLDRRGYRLRKSPRRDPLAVDYGLYYIDHNENGEWVTVLDGIPFERVERFVSQMSGAALPETDDSA